MGRFSREIVQRLKRRIEQQEPVPVASDDTLASYTFPALASTPDNLDWDDLRLGERSLAPKEGAKILTDQAVIHSSAIATLRRPRVNEIDMLIKDLDVATALFACFDYPWQSFTRLRMLSHRLQEKHMVPASRSTPTWMFRGTCCAAANVLKRVDEAQTWPAIRTAFTEDLTETLGRNFPLDGLVKARPGEKRREEGQNWIADKGRLVVALGNWAEEFKGGQAGPFVDQRHRAQEHYESLERLTANCGGAAELNAAYESLLEFAVWQARFLQLGI